METILLLFYEPESFLSADFMLELIKENIFKKENDILKCTSEFFILIYLLPQVQISNAGVMSHNLL